LGHVDDQPQDVVAGGQIVEGEMQRRRVAADKSRAVALEEGDRGDTDVENVQRKIEADNVADDVALAAELEAVVGVDIATGLPEGIAEEPDAGRPHVSEIDRGCLSADGGQQQAAADY